MPKHIGRFEVRAHLGAGAYGAVYRAYDPQLDREVALKIPQAAVLNNPRRVKRFLREACAAAQLRHPHIVPIFDAGRDGSQYFIASAFISGQSLSETIDGPMEFDRAARIARELAQALAHAHSQRVIHRDVKPSNIMLDAEDHAHLMDFGVAHRHDLEDRLTKEGEILGTPAYMAPEQAESKGDDARPAADQYSLGVVLYEMLCGEPPFTGSPAVVIHNLLHEDPALPRKLNPQVPVDLETITLKAIAKRSEDRYADCDALADDLRRWQEGEPIKARQLGTWERLVRWCKKEPRLALAGSLVILSLLAGAIVAAVSAHFLSLAAGHAREKEDQVEQALRNEEATKRELQIEHRALLTAYEKERAANKKAEERGEELNVQKQHLEGTLDELRFKNVELDKAKAEAERQQRAAVENLELSREELYVNLLSSVMPASRNPRDAVSSKTAATVLRNCPQQCRDWEWNHLRIVYTSNDAEKSFEKQLGLPTAKLEPYQAAMLTFSPSSRYLVAAVNFVGSTTRGEVLMYELPDGVRRKFTYNGKLHRIAFSPDADEKFLAVCGDRDKIQIYDVEKEEKAFELDCAKDSATDVAFDPKGKLLAAVLSTGKLRVWNLDKREVEFNPEVDKNIRVLFADSKHLIAACRDKTVRIIPLGADTEKPTILSQPSAVTDLAVSLATNHLAVACEDGIVRVWNLTTKQQVGNPLLGHNKAILSVSYTSDGKRLATCSLDGTIRLWHGRTGKQIIRFNTSLYPFLVAFSPDNRYLAWHGGKITPKTERKFGETVVLWDSARGRAEELSIGGLPSTAVRLAFHPDPERHLVASGGIDGRVELWDSESGERRTDAPSEGVGGPVRHLIFSKDGSRLIYASAKRLRIWDFKQEKEVLDREITGGEALAIAISPTGETLSLLSGRTAGNSPFAGEILIVDIKSNSSKRVAVEKMIALAAWLRFSADGRELLTTSAGEIVRWDVETGKPMGAIPKQGGALPIISNDGTIIRSPQLGQLEIFDRKAAKTQGKIPALRWSSQELTVFNPDYSRVAGPAHGGFALYKLGETKPEDHCGGHFGKIHDLVFSPDGERVATCAEDGTIMIWKVKPGPIERKANP